MVNTWDGCFVPVLTPRFHGRSNVLNVDGEDCLWGSGVDWRWGIRAMWEAVKTAPHSLLSCLLSIASSTSPMLPKARRRSKEANIKGIPEILFFCALSHCCLRYRYGNAKSQIQPVPWLQRMPDLIWLSLTLCSSFFSSIPCCLTPSSASLSSSSSRFSPAAPQACR